MIALETIPTYLQNIPSLTSDILNNCPSRIISDEIIDSSFVPMSEEMLNKLRIKDPRSIKFDPKKHLLFTDNYYEKTKKWTLEDLEVKEFHQEPITNIGVTEPFPLFTDEAVAIMRWELLKKDTVKFAGRHTEHSNSESDDIEVYIRGHARDHDSFTYEAWKHPETLKILSKLANVELDHVFDYEMAHSNISIKLTQDEEEFKPLDDEEEELSQVKGSVTWHYDSPQMVCVLMLSDTTNMMGGETALQTGNGKVAKVKGPKQGWATLLQGRILKHIATQPKGNYTERITSVASLRPKDPLQENLFVTTIKPSEMAGSRYNDFYQDYLNYTLDVLVDRINILKDDINKSISKGEKFNQLETIDYLQNKIIKYAEHSYQEFEAVDDGLVAKPDSYNVITARWK